MSTPTPQQAMQMVMAYTQKKVDLFAEQSIAKAKEQDPLVRGRVLIDFDYDCNTRTINNQSITSVFIVNNKSNQQI